MGNRAYLLLSIFAFSAFNKNRFAYKLAESFGLTCIPRERGLGSNRCLVNFGRRTFLHQEYILLFHMTGHRF